VSRKTTKETFMENARVKEMFGRLRWRFRGMDPEHAKECWQQAWVNVREMQQQTPVRDEEAYLGPVITNISAALGREGKRHREGLLRYWEFMKQTSQGASEQSPESIAEAREKALQTAVEKLPPSLRGVIELDLQGLPDQEIADRLGIKLSSVKTFLMRARARLAILLQEVGHGDE